MLKIKKKNTVYVYIFDLFLKNESNEFSFFVKLFLYYCIFF